METGQTLREGDSSPTTLWLGLQSNNQLRMDTNHEDRQHLRKGTPPAAAQAKSGSCNIINSPIFEEPAYFQGF